MYFEEATVIASIYLEEEDYTKFLQYLDELGSI
jgi:hypothetical protein